MFKDGRITYRRRHSYRTINNRVKAVKTPGGNLIAQYIKKRGKIPSCGDCGAKLLGIKAMRPLQMKRAPKRSRKVERAYGGSRCAKCVRERILRAFLIEEQRVAKQMVTSKKKK